ncbi:SDR family NAD(P)-dependent oxidoreductase [Mesorhizobium sp. J428]|uniref:SDR family NAD(P)-dependent oxidoreductase n=1 Tax=Mesorhizobium sp. J428 TaxID=2898440 RepID=UPI0021518AE4|nr:SDR family NAD(P)-dependent oxidoreductase [Mesorhizobium sp. J428]
MAAFVTGAGSGIGRGIALALAHRGVSVGVCDIRLDDAEKTASLIKAAGGKALAVKADVSVRESVEEAADAVSAAFGAVSILCNNAGIAMHGVPLHEIKQADWDWVIGVNVRRRDPRNECVHAPACSQPESRRMS